MDEKEIIRKLHPYEKSIILALKKMEGADASKIAEITNLPEPSIQKASMWASVKGLIKHKEAKKYEIRITEEGKRYLRIGLPEKRLLKLVIKGQNSVKKLKRTLKDFGIGVAWARRNGWIKISNGKLTLTNKGKSFFNKKTEIEKFLETKKTSDKKLIKMLKSRKLIEISEDKKKFFYLTKKGEDIAPSISRKDEISVLTPEMIKSGTWKSKKFRIYDINTPVPKIFPAKIHPYVQFLNKTRKKLIGLGFQEVKGPFVELQFWNCDALFMPQDHPARGIHDIFKLKKPKKGLINDKGLIKRVEETHKNGWITGSNGWGYWDTEKVFELILRSQTTSVSVRTLFTVENVPAKFFTIGRVFRPDVVDASHLFEFHQAEGIVIGEKLNLKNLLGFLKIFGKEIADAERIRFRPSYFPFTEPSVELQCMINGQWMEVGGAGIFRPEVTKPLGINWPVLAWGIGITRLAMIKIGVEDLRCLFSHNLNWLRNSKMVV